MASQGPPQAADGSTATTYYTYTDDRGVIHQMKQVGPLTAEDLATLQSLGAREMPFSEVFAAPGSGLEDNMDPSVAETLAPQREAMKDQAKVNASRNDDLAVANSNTSAANGQRVAELQANREHQKAMMALQIEKQALILKGQQATLTKDLQNQDATDQSNRFALEASGATGGAGQFVYGGMQRANQFQNENNQDNISGSAIASKGLDQQAAFDAASYARAMANSADDYTRTVASSTRQSEKQKKADRNAYIAALKG